MHPAGTFLPQKLTIWTGPTLTLRYLKKCFFFYTLIKQRNFEFDTGPDQLHPSIPCSLGHPPISQLRTKCFQSILPEYNQCFSFNDHQNDGQNAFITQWDNFHGVLTGMTQSTDTKWYWMHHLMRTKKREHITPVLMTLHWLPVCFGIDFKVLFITNKALHGVDPEYITELLSSCQTALSLRSSGRIPLQD